MVPNSTAIKTFLWLFLMNIAQIQLHMHNGTRSILIMIEEQYLFLNIYSFSVCVKYEWEYGSRVCSVLCACGYVSVSTCVHMLVGARRTCGVACSIILCLISVRQDLSMNLELGWWLASYPHVSTRYYNRVIGRWVHTLLFTWVWHPGSGTPTSAFTHRATSPFPILGIFFLNKIS